MTRQHRAKSAAFAASAAVALVAGVTAPAQTSEIQRAYLAHTASCVGLFFTDIATHEANCLPNNSVSVFQETTSGSAAVVIVVPPPLPPVIPDDNCYPGIADCDSPT